MESLELTAVIHSKPGCSAIFPSCSHRREPWVGSGSRRTSGILTAHAPAPGAVDHCLPPLHLSSPGLGSPEDSGATPSDWEQLGVHSSFPNRPKASL